METLNQLRVASHLNNFEDFVTWPGLIKIKSGLEAKGLVNFQPLSDFLSFSSIPS